MLELELKDPILTGPLTLYPLFVPTAAPDDYLTGVDLDPDVLEVDESDGGHVPTLLVTHRHRRAAPDPGGARGSPMTSVARVLPSSSGRVP